jgi:trk system potassium uptake protein TrkH
MTPGLPSRRSRRRLRSQTTTSGMLLAGALTPLAVLAGTTDSVLVAPVWRQVTTGLAIYALLLAGLVIAHRPRLGRTAATLAVFGLFGLGLPYLRHAPALTLAALVAGTLALALVWELGPLLAGAKSFRRRRVHEGRAQGAAILALALWLLFTLFDATGSPIEVATVGWAMGVATLLGVAWATRNWQRRQAHAKLVVAALVVSLGVVPLVWGQWWWVASCFLVLCSAAVHAIRRPTWRGMEPAGWLEPLLGQPERLFVGTFAGLSLVGTVLLALPYSSTAGHGIGLMDAAFTSTSAVCVTGLVVRDTPVDFSTFGQVVILLLIQVGGLGIMTFSTVLLWALGRRMSLRHEGVVASLLSSQDHGRLFGTALQILQLTLVAEAFGALLLGSAFMARGDDLATASWRAVFTSISAFCNAGFALQSDSLVSFQQSPFVLHVVALLIIAGGLSPLAILAVPSLLRGSPTPGAAQAKLGLVATAVLLVVGFCWMLAFEWNGVLGGLPLAARLHNAWFQSVTLRTAGFNSVDLTAARPATWTLMMVWMFIGGNPGGTAGGVKTTTASVLVLSVVEAIRGQWVLEAFGRRIPERSRAKAAVVVTVATATVIAALVSIQLTQAISTREGAFEVVSALGTVGLSIGGTARLDGIGKAIIITCMFAGRVGGLTLLMFLGRRRQLPALGYPAEEIDVG